MAIKGFIKDWKGQRILPITRAELVLDQNGNPAFTSALFEAGHVNADGTVNQYGLISAAERALITGGSTGQGISERIRGVNIQFECAEIHLSRTVSRQIITVACGVCHTV